MKAESAKMLIAFFKRQHIEFPSGRTLDVERYHTIEVDEDEWEFINREMPATKPIPISHFFPGLSEAMDEWVRSLSDAILAGQRALWHKWEFLTPPIREGYYPGKYYHRYLFEQEHLRRSAEKAEMRGKRRNRSPKFVGIKQEVESESQKDRAATKEDIFYRIAEKRKMSFEAVKRAYYYQPKPSKQ